MNLSEPFIRRPVAAWLAVGLLLLVVAGGLGLWRMAAVASSTICRGVDCIVWTSAGPAHVQRSSLRDRCFYLGSPTGIGVFMERPLGGVIRSLLGTEYSLLGTEFLFIEPSDLSEPVIVIDANRYEVGSARDAFCIRGTTHLTFDTRAKRIDIAGCPFGSAEPSRAEAECRVEDGRREKTGAGGNLP